MLFRAALFFSSTSKKQKKTCQPNAISGSTVLLFNFNKIKKNVSTKCYFGQRCLWHCVKKRLLHAMACYEKEGLYLDLGELGCLQVCVKQYANRDTDVGTYVRHAQVFDGKTLMKVVVAPGMWVGVDIYHTLGSYSSIEGGGIPYQWVHVNSQGVESDDVAPRGAGIWAVHKSWESAAPARIWLDAAHPTEQWLLRDSATQRTLLTIQIMLPPITLV